MKNLGFLLAGLMAVMPVSLIAQESTTPDWQFMPTVQLVKYFPGEKIKSSGSFVTNFYYQPEYNFAGTGLSFNVRCFHDRLSHVALTFGGGVNWFYQPEQNPVYAVSPTTTGIGESLKYQEFNTFPLTLGVQAVFPSAGKEQVMFFFGGEASVNFISGNIDIGQQTKLGYTIVGGFAVKIFEFGIRYSAFSDLKNLGAQLGLRLNSFSI